MSNDQLQLEEGPNFTAGLKNLGFAILLLGVAYYFFSTMSKYEAGQEISMNRILFLAYGFLGKNVTTGIVAAIGAFFGFSGIKEMIQSRS